MALKNINPNQTRPSNKLSLNPNSRPLDIFGKNNPLSIHLHNLAINESNIPKKEEIRIKAQDRHNKNQATIIHKESKQNINKIRI